MARRIRTPGQVEQQRLVEEAADRAASESARRMLIALRAFRDKFSAADLRRIADGEPVEFDEKLLKTVRVPLGRVSEEVGDLLFTGILGGRRSASRHVPASVRAQAEAAARRTGITARAASWAGKRGADLVTAVADGARKAIRLAVADGVARGAHASAIARELRDMIGLDERRARALVAARAADRARGLSESEIERRSGAFAGRLLRDRAETIARTEVFTAYNEGRNDLWRELADENVVRPDGVRRTWITSRDERVDDICEELDGETVALNEEFSGGIFSPPAHPQCRCTLAYEVA